MQLKSLIAVPLVVLALTGCSSQAQNLQPSETSGVEKPLFASDEEALAAAQTAYAHYLEVSDQIARDGGANPERLKGMVSLGLYREQESAYSELQSSNFRAGGTTKMDSFHFQSSPNLSGSLIAYVCLDVADNPVMDSEGNDVTPIGRQSRIPLTISFSSMGNRELLIESSEVWSGVNFC